MLPYQETKRISLRLFAIALIFSAVFIYSETQAETTLPATACDTQWNAVTHLNQRFATVAMEDGTKAFKYGPDNDNFVSEVGSIVTFQPELLFTPPATKVFKVYAIGVSCGVFYADSSTYMNAGVNTISYNRDTNAVKFNDEEPSAVSAGIPRYLGFDVWDGVNGSNFASYSYLVDLNNLQNPVGVPPPPPPEPSGPRPVLIIPGISGTELFKDDELIWPNISEMLATNDVFLSQNLALDSQGYPLVNIRTGDVIKEIRVKIPALNIDTQIQDIFQGLSDYLELQNYQSNSTYFIFPYDWRLDLSQNNLTLKNKIDSIRELTGFDKVDIIAHSMGGLVAKSYIDEFGTMDLNKLIFVGTPHLGAPKAGKVIMHGDNLGIPFLDKDRIRDIAVNAPAIYELLPNSRYFDVFRGYIEPYRFLGSSAPLGYQETKEFLRNRGVNSGLIDRAETFFSKDLHDQNFGDIQVYNIAGCANSTQAAYVYGITNSFIGTVKYASGDGTVPLPSADYINIPTANKYYAPDTVHSELPSDQNVKQLIYNILTGNNLLPGSISQDVAVCGFKGKSLTWRSPVEVHIYDALGNHTGPAGDGIENNIPGVDYEIIDGEKFIFLPADDGENYRVEGMGEATGIFDLLISDVDNGDVARTAVYNDVAITDSSRLNFSVNSATDNATINFDFDGDGQFDALNSDAILNDNEAGDLTAPITEAVVSGIQGNNSWHRSPVTIDLHAQDENSGILYTKYSMDGINFSTYENPIVVSQEGITQLSYYSVDRAGNNEPVKSIEIKIDQTAPELFVLPDFINNGFQFSSVDNIDAAASLDCGINGCLISDQAGNTTRVIFSKEKSLHIKSVSYNEQPANFLPENEFKLKGYDQVINIRKVEKARIDYNSRKDQSTIVLSSRGNRTREIVKGLKSLQLATKEGILNITIK